MSGCHQRSYGRRSNAIVGALLTGATFLLRALAAGGWIAQCIEYNISVRAETLLTVSKARELTQRGCYNVQITTPEGRTYHSSEFGDLPRTPVASRRLSQKHPPTP